ncbi:MAG TPA: hypothetical protein PLS49_00165 [Candidatus Woesebacteria bacterium]|nr:hypothetical protein [Candidatus Woesebacteria bacterium]
MSFTLLKKRSLIVFAVIAYLIPLTITMYSIFSGSIAFWYDPARDLLSGLANLEKITLIGPTSGIPGLFYGPYWIWMLSVGLLISHDPRIVAFIVAALPYFTILPFVFYKLSTIVGKIPAIIGWLLFMLGFGGYSAQLWNPHPAPLLVFALITLLVFIPERIRTVPTVLYLLFTGFVAGLLIQFHISFGISVVIGVMLFQLLFAIYEIYSQSNKFNVLVKHVVVNVLLGIGILVAALPFFVFELRHGFGQITTIFNTLTSDHSVVGVTGISDGEIVQYFVERYGRLLSLSLSAAGIIGAITIAVYGYQRITSRKVAHTKELRLILLTSVIGLTVLTLYLVSRNPVWDYHFIGVEVLFVMIIIAMISRSRILVTVYGGIVVYIAIMSLLKLQTELHSDPLRLTSLATKEHVVSKVFADAQNDQFALIAYNPAIYTFDYDYLSQWIATKNNKEGSVTDSQQAKNVYLVIPPHTSKEIVEDFINYKTPSSEFSTVDTWKIVDGTVVIKRAKMIE